MLASAMLFAIAPPVQAAGPTRCGADCLDRTMVRYLDALTHQRPAALRWAPGAVITENGEAVAVGHGLWRTATGLGRYRIFASDPITQQVAFSGVVREKSASTMLAVRLKLRAGWIIESETIVARALGPGTDAAAAGRLGMARSGMRRASTADSNRGKLREAVSRYYAAIGKSAPNIKFDPGCRRIENGVAFTDNPSLHLNYVATNGRPLPNFAAMNCNDQFASGIWSADSVTALRISLIDERRGLVVAFGYYNAFAKAKCATTRQFGNVCPVPETKPVTLRVAETFHVVAGRIREIESVWNATGYPAKSIWDPPE